MKSEDKPQDRKEEKRKNGKLHGHGSVETSVVRDPDPDPQPPPPGNR